MFTNPACGVVPGNNFHWEASSAFKSSTNKRRGGRPAGGFGRLHGHMSFTADGRWIQNLDRRLVPRRRGEFQDRPVIEFRAFQLNISRKDVNIRGRGSIDGRFALSYLD